MPQDKENPDNQLGELPKSSDLEPGPVDPASPKTAEERFEEQVQRLLRSVDPSHVDDTWEGCGRDAAS